jgi:hypothetical protein
MSSLEETLKVCRLFLQQYFGEQDAAPTLPRIGLRLVCMGNAEMTVQGELLHFLRKNDFNAVSEAGLPGSRRRFDIMVFDKQWKAVVCLVELKHYSANQDSKRIPALPKLFLHLNEDSERHNDFPGIAHPLIQIGLFTELLVPTPRVTPDTHSFYRFLGSYRKRSKTEYDYAGNINSDYALVKPALSEFPLADNDAIVKGRVSYVFRTYRTPE